ncbi:MAG TPA: hypothetical protein VFN82_01810 [Solirubrobacterales bacterium]|nr:hypothetical protein [Solirubrobacterales bacterium]
MALALALVPGQSLAAAQGADHRPSVQNVGRALVAALGTTRAGGAVAAIDRGLALLGARYRLEHLPAHPQRRPSPAPEVITDPSKMPPASAGSNGTTVPHTSGLSRDEIFAHSRGDGESTAILLTGVALAPPDAPESVQGAIDAANTIVGRPYVWGGGHGSFYSRGYDCSGAVSFALFGGGLIPEPLTSLGLEHWGAPGPGKWITVYANAGHAFAEIAGLRWDTVGDENGSGPRWHLAPTDTSGFVARHPPGL